MIRLFTRLLPIIAFAAILPGAAGAQESTSTGTVTGQLREAGTGARVNSGRVNVVGTGITVPVRDDGTYTIRGVAPGRVEIRVFSLGHEVQKLPVTVAAGTTARLDFTLPIAAVRLDEIVTTATGDQRRLELGTVVGQVNAAKLVQNAPVRNMSDLLTGRVPGVHVLGGALTGTGGKVRIRGQNSVSLNNDPIYIIDGIAMQSSTGSSSIGVGGPIPSRVSDINPTEIETIEVVKGPSAATLYGTDAANGVIVITTKRGRPGKARWSTFVERGTIVDRNTYPTAYSLFGHRPATPAVSTQSCVIAQLSTGACVQDSVLAFNLFVDPETTPLAHGWREQYGAQVSGGSETLRYFLSTDYEGETGVLKVPVFDIDRLNTQVGFIPGEQLRPNAYNRVSTRGNMNISLSPNADIAVSTGFTASTQRLPQTDNNGTGLLSSAYGGPGFRNNGNGSLGNPLNGYRVFTPGDIFQETVKQEINRFIGSISPNWRPSKWLTARGNFGLDFTNRVDSDLCRFANCSNSGVSRLGFKIQNRTNFFDYTAASSATAQFNVNPVALSKTTLGVQYVRRLFARNGASSTTLPPGTTTVSAGAVKNAAELTDLAIAAGVFIEQTFALHDRLFITGALREDNNSAFGKDFKKIVYPKASLSWVLSDEPFFPKLRFLDQFRFRTAYGATGESPGPNDALPFYLGTTVNVNDVATSGILYSATGNALLKPERGTELEIGTDLSLLDKRLGIEFTHYNKKTRDALISRPLPGSIGVAASRFENLGSVQNKGYELGINTQLVQSRAIGVDLAITGAWNENKLISLGGVPPIIGTTNRTIEGYPLIGWWQRRYTFDDKNSDGIITVDELTVDDSATYIGRPAPHVEIVYNPGIDFFNNLFRLTAQIDHKGGQTLENDTERIRCQTRNNCRGLKDPTAPLARQAASVALRDHASKSQFGFFERNDFTRLREVSLTFNAPASWGAAS